MLLGFVEDQDAGVICVLLSSNLKQPVKIGPDQANHVASRQVEPEIEAILMYWFVGFKGDPTSFQDER